MPSANLLFSETFDGAGYPDFDVEWPGFSFGVTGDNPPFARPVVDGHGHGIASRFVRLNWSARSTSYPGRDNYKCDLWAKWQNPGFSGERYVDLYMRFRDFDNWLAARVTSKATANPTLELVKKVGGTESVLGTYTGSGLTAAQMATMKGWRCRVQDLDTGNTLVEVFTDPTGATSDGDLRISYTGNVGVLRGQFGPGVGCGGALGSEIRIDKLECYDFADEWTAVAPPAPGTGWQMLIGDDLMHVDEWADQSPPIELIEVAQGYGPGNNSVQVKVGGQFQLGPIVPNVRCEVYHDGDRRFNGYLRKGKLAGQPNSETQTWTGRDALWNARNVYVTETNGMPQRFYNVRDPEAEEYRGDRQNMTIGAIIQELFDEYSDVVEGLRYYGAIPESRGTLGYVLSELNLLDTVVPDLAVGGTFIQCVLSLLQWQFAHQLWQHPEDKIWHFIDVTALTGETVTLTTDHVTLALTPDADKSYTAIEWCGSLPEDKDGVEITMTKADRAWNQNQEDGHKKSKRHLKAVSGSFTAAGNAPFPIASADQPPTALVYIDVPVSLGLGSDDWIGSVASVQGDGWLRWVVANTSSRIWLSAPLWGGGTPPAAGFFTLSLVHPSAIPYLSANGVGRAMIFPPAVICGNTGLGKFSGLKQKGGCTRVMSREVDEDGNEYYVNRAYEVHRLSTELSNGFSLSQQAAFGNGGCPTYLETAEQPLPEIGLVNYLPPPGGSPPNSPCEKTSPIDGIELRVTLAESEVEAPCFRVPTNEGEWRGRAFSRTEANWDGGGEANKAEGDFGVRRVLRVDHPAFRDSATQEAGLKKAAEALLKVYGEESWQVTCTIASNWKAQGVIRPVTGTDTWANLTKMLYIASGKRTTGFESTVGLKLPVFKVTWKIRANETVLEAGTANGWLAPDAKLVTEKFTKADALRQTARLIQRLEEFRNCVLDKPQELGMQTGNIPGCDVAVINRDTKTVKNVEIDDENKENWINHQGLGALATDLLTHGRDEGGERGKVAQPGMNDAEHQFPIGGALPLRPHTNHRVPFMGPPSGGINADKGRYGGLPGAMAADGLKPPQEIIRRGPVAFRKKADGAGSTGAATGIEVGLLDAAGAVGAWVDYEDNNTLRALGVDPFALTNSRSLIQDLDLRARAAAAQIRSYLNDDGLTAAPGDVTTEFPDGAPPNVSSYLRTQALASGYFRPVSHTWDDPGGMVFQGPMIRDVRTDQLIAGSEDYWVVRVPENVLVQVTDVGWGSGRNGGKWAYDTSGLGGTTEYIESVDLVVLHKQGADAEDVSAAFAAAPGNMGEPHMGLDASHPWGMQGSRYQMHPTASSAMAWMFTLPEGTRGQIGVEIGFREDPNNPIGAGNSTGYAILSTISLSPWGAPTAPGAGALAGNAGGDAQGQYRGPGGAVPPGLRSPYGPDFSVAVHADGSGTGGGFSMLVSGASIESMRVHGGWALFVTEAAVDVAETAIFNDSHVVESLVVADAVAFEIQPVYAEAVAVGEGYALTLNPDVDEEESVGVADEVALQII